MSGTTGMSPGMSPTERRAALSLSGIFALRMLGLFLVLPVLALYAHTLDGATPLLIGLALGAYGLTQACLQVPFGMASDRLGRKPVITVGLILFATGSMVCAEAGSIGMMVAGRMLQGSGAIAAAVTAMMADLTREEHRTRAMAMLGGMIAMSFAVSLVAAPLLGAHWGVDNIFRLVAALAALSIIYLWVFVPDPPATRHHRDTEVTASDLGQVLADSNLRRLDFGVFVLHMALTCVFVSVPLLLAQHMDPAGLWKVYLPVMLVSFAIMVPTTLLAEVKGKIRLVLLTGIGMVAASCIVFMAGAGSVAGVIAGLCVFFIGFNMLEPVLPSLVTKFSPAGAKGTGSGVFNTCQFLGPFVGGTVGGWLAGYGPVHLFAFVLAAALAWLLVAWGMQTPIPYKQVVVPLSLADDTPPDRVAAALTALEGVGGVRLFVEEGEVHVRFQAKLISMDDLFDAVRGLARG